VRCRAEALYAEEKILPVNLITPFQTLKYERRSETIYNLDYLEIFKQKRDSPPRYGKLLLLALDYKRFIEADYRSYRQDTGEVYGIPTKL